MSTSVFHAKATEIENKIPGINNLAKKAAMNTKAGEFESKIPEITNLVTKVSFNIAKTEYKMPETTSFITTSKFDRLAKIRFDETMKEATKSLASKSRWRDGSIKSPTTPSNSLVPKLKRIHY